MEHKKYIEVVIETGWAHSNKEGGKERESGKSQEKKKGKKKRGERGFGELWVFLVFCLTVCFHSIPFLPPFFNPPCHHTPSPRPHSPYHTPHTTCHATTRVCRGVCCLRVAVFVCRCLPALSSLNPNHDTPSNHPIHHTQRHQCMSQ